eukprot:TRINITY_DN40345_c0_g2_i1.p1 TRINITY_DN40345_c0_g2~~TRINITY_DN40345_c0_g2_i1.p1  ORF type:complete len:165 (+),score=7.39 TRINITY_DN40345_c0_g2_i1:24-497(+)
MVEGYLNARAKERERILRNIHHYMTKEMITPEEILDSMKPLMDPEFLDDIKEDAPRINRFFGHVMGVLFSMGSSIESLREICIDHFSEGERTDMINGMVAIALYFGKKAVSEKLIQSLKPLSKGLTKPKEKWEINSPLVPDLTLFKNTLDALVGGQE